MTTIFIKYVKHSFVLVVIFLKNKKEDRGYLESYVRVYMRKEPYSRFGRGRVSPDISKFLVNISVWDIQSQGSQVRYLAMTRHRTILNLAYRSPLAAHLLTSK